MVTSKSSLVRVSAIQAKTVGGQLAPPPARQPMADVPVGAITMAMHASDDIKATTGMFDAALGARGPATSGIQEREQSAKVASPISTTRTTSIVPCCKPAMPADMIPAFSTPNASRASWAMDETITSAPINKRLEQPEMDEKPERSRRRSMI